MIPNRGTARRLPITVKTNGASCPSLKNRREATVIRHKILSAFEMGQRSVTAAELASGSLRDRRRRRHWNWNWPARSPRSPTETLKDDFRPYQFPKTLNIILMEGATAC